MKWYKWLWPLNWFKQKNEYKLPTNWDELVKIAHAYKINTEQKKSKNKKSINPFKCFIDGIQCVGEQIGEEAWRIFIVDALALVMLPIFCITYFVSDVFDDESITGMIYIGLWFAMHAIPGAIIWFSRIIKQLYNKIIRNVIKTKKITIEQTKSEIVVYIKSKLDIVRQKAVGESSRIQTLLYKIDELLKENSELRATYEQNRAMPGFTNTERMLNKLEIVKETIIKQRDWLNKYKDSIADVLAKCEARLQIVIGRVDARALAEKTLAHARNVDMLADEIQTEAFMIGASVINEVQIIANAMQSGLEHTFALPDPDLSSQEIMDDMRALIESSKERELAELQDSLLMPELM